MTDTYLETPSTPLGVGRVGWVKRFKGDIDNLNLLGREQAVSPTRYGIVGDGTDEGAKWQAMLDDNGRNTTYVVPMPPVAYGIGTTVNLTRSHDGVRFLGVGPRLVAAPNSGKGVYFKRLSAAPCFSVGAISVEFDHCSFDCQGATHTGWALEFVTPAAECLVNHGAFWNIPDGSYAININTPRDAVTYNANGYRIHVDEVMFVPVNAWGPIAAIKYPMDIDGTHTGVNSSGGNRRVSNCVSGSMPLLDASAGADDFTIIGCIGGGFLDGPNAVKGSYVGGRLTVPPGPPMQVLGANHVIVGNTWNGNDIELGSTANGCIIAANNTPYKVIYTSVHPNHVDNPFDAGGVGLQVGTTNSRIFAYSALTEDSTEGFVYLPMSGLGPKVPPATHHGAPFWVVSGQEPQPRLYTVGVDGLPYSQLLGLGGALLATDDFNRGDNGAGAGALGSNSLGAWTIGSDGDAGIAGGALGISGNQAYNFNPATDAHAWYDFGSAAVLVTAQVTTTLVGDTSVGLLLSRSDATHYLTVRFGVNFLSLTANVGGVRSVLDTDTCVLPSGTPTYVRAVRWGGRVIIWVGGTMVNTYLTGATKIYDDTPAGLPTLTGATKHGLYIATGVNGERVDNWQARRL